MDAAGDSWDTNGFSQGPAPRTAISRRVHQQSLVLHAAKIGCSPHTRSFPAPRGRLVTDVSFAALQVPFRDGPGSWKLLSFPDSADAGRPWSAKRTESCRLP